MRHIYLLAMLLATLLATSCADDDRRADDTIPDGYGRLSFTIGTSDALATRSVSTTNTWLEGTTDERAIKSYVILICEGTTIVQKLSKNTETSLGDHDATNHYFPTSANIQSELMTLGNHALTVYCLANFTDAMLESVFGTGGLSAIGTTLPTGFEDKAIKISNCSSLPSTGMPMTGKLTATVNIKSGQTATKDTSDKDLVLILWRMLAKMEFQFTNQSSEQVKILGIEVEPINQASATNGGIYLFSKDDLESITNLAAPNLSEAANDVTATWPLHETMQTQATLSSASFFSQAQLSWGTKLESTGYREASDAAHTKLQIFKALEKVTHLDEGSAIVFAVKPNSGYTFTPKSLSFKATRGGTNGGHFDVVAIGNGTSTTLATGVRPMRYNGNGDEKTTYISTYEYSLNHSATSGVFYVKIYLYDLDLDKDYAFSDVVITGDVKSIGVGKGESITLPQAALTDVGKVKYEPSTELTLNASGGTGNLFFYVNETDATYTTVENQLSVRFKIQRNGYTEELRYGVTTPYIDGRTGGDGFNVIRRNDWIHIPVVLRDWQFRVEPVAFVPIAGYPATTLSSDALTATFSTGGPIILQPFAQKNNDGTWRDFSDPEVTFVSMTATGDTQMFETAPSYDSTTQRITGILRNNLSAGTYKTTLTVNVKLGPSGSQYDYSFTFNVVLQK